MNTVAECTLPEKILLAAHDLEESGQSPFSAEALIVSAWQHYPRTFGLKGYTELYPDANKVLSSIMGEKGLARRGWLVKMGQKLYALTREGRQVVRRLQQADDQAEVTTESMALTGEQDRLILTLLGSVAWQKYRDGRKAELTFPDACRFWNINEQISLLVLDQRLHSLGVSLHEIERQLGSVVVVLSNGHKLASDQVSQLTELHDYMEDRFERHLMLVRNRAERR